MPKGTALCSWSYQLSLWSPSEKLKLFIFDPMRSCGHQIRQQLVVCVPFCVWDVGCATASRCLHFSQLTNCSVQYGLCVTSWRDDFRFQSFQIAIPKREAESELPVDESHQKKKLKKIPGRALYSTVSVRCTVNAERQACEVQRMLL